MKKIVFYIRALYKDNISPYSEEFRNNKQINLFNSISQITVQDYRQRIHNIQLQCLRSISNTIIYNTPIFTKELYSQPYYKVQEHAKRCLLELDDSDVVVPLDDDDWVSPDIALIPFEEDTITVWNTTWFNKKPKFEKFKKNYQFLHNEVYDEKLSFSLSNCFAINANIVKTFIKDNKTPELHELLQFHPHTRSVVEKRGFKEKIIDNYYAIYVKHLCNDTTFKQFFKDEKNPKKEEYLDMVLHLQNIDYNKELISEEFKWSLPYFDELIKLNNSII